MDTELKVMRPYNVLNEDQPVPSVCVKHVVEYSVHDYDRRLRHVTKSPVFRLEDDAHAFEARVVFYDSSSTDNAFAVYLQFMPEDKDRINGRLSFYLRGHDGSNIWKQDCILSKHTVGELGWGVNETIPPNYRHGLCNWFRIKSLVIVCEIYLDLGGNMVAPETTFPQFRLSRDFGLLLSTGQQSDITFKVGDKELKAHKVIVSARSPMFNKMFKCDIAESQYSTIEIPDIDFEVLHSVLVYIYTDQVVNIDILAEDLLAAAEQYQLDDLKAKCEEALAKSLSVENAAHMFMLAELHRADHLKSQAITFINGHRHQVMETKEWKLAKENHLKILGRAFL